jgi:cytochrome c-type biogenesis protein CcmH/NrfF
LCVDDDVEARAGEINQGVLEWVPTNPLRSEETQEQVKEIIDVLGCGQCDGANFETTRSNV